MSDTDLRNLYRDHGQSLWLDNLSRGLLTEDGLPKLIESRGIRGVTSNPAIFKKAIVGSEDYIQDIRRLRPDYPQVEDLYEHLVVADIQRACDLLRPVWDQSHGEDGWVSWEESPSIANDAEQSVRAASHLKALADRPNLLIKVPATPAGIKAFEQLIAKGISVNVTLIFSLEQVKAVFAAYLRGLEALEASGGDLSAVRAVASVFMSRVDSLVDKQLAANGDADALAGKAALALAGMAYQHFEEVFAQPRFAQLKAKGAREQYLLWASTGTKNPDYSDVLYVENLIAPKTINTLPDATLAAFAEHGRVAATLKAQIPQHQQVWAQLADAGIDMDGPDVAGALLDDGVAQFQSAFDDLLQAIANAD